MITGGGDPRMQMALSPALEGVNASDLKLEVSKAAFFTKLQRRSPMQADMMALELVKDGRSPEIMLKFAKQWGSLLALMPFRVGYPTVAALASPRRSLQDVLT